MLFIQNINIIIIIVKFNSKIDSYRKLEGLIDSLEIFLKNQNHIILIKIMKKSQLIKG